MKMEPLRLQKLISYQLVYKCFYRAILIRCLKTIDITWHYRVDKVSKKSGRESFFFFSKVRESQGILLEVTERSMV